MQISGGRGGKTWAMKESIKAQLADGQQIYLVDRSSDGKISYQRVYGVVDDPNTKLIEPSLPNRG